MQYIDIYISCTIRYQRHIALLAACPCLLFLTLLLGLVRHLTRASFLTPRFCPASWGLTWSAHAPACSHSLHRNATVVFLSHPHTGAMVTLKQVLHWTQSMAHSPLVSKFKSPQIAPFPLCLSAATLLESVGPGSLGHAAGLHPAPGIHQGWLGGPAPHGFTIFHWAWCPEKGAH